MGREELRFFLLLVLLAAVRDASDPITSPVVPALPRGLSSSGGHSERMYRREGGSQPRKEAKGAHHVAFWLEELTGLELLKPSTLCACKPMGGTLLVPMPSS